MRSIVVARTSCGGRDRGSTSLTAVVLTPVFVVIAVIWNPVFPFPFTGPVWTAAQPVAAVVFLVAGALIKVKRA